MSRSVLAAITLSLLLSGSALAAEWRYTDGAGKTVELDHVPSRIIANGSSAAALLALGIRPVGIYADGPIVEDLALRNLDLSGITILSEVWGEIDLEKAIALDADLIVAEWWPLEQAYSGMEGGTNGDGEKLTELVPIVGVKQGNSVVTLIEDYVALAETLGADPSQGQLAADKAAFEASVESFKAAVAAKPDLTVLAASPDADGLYIAVPQHSSELVDFQNWGLNLVVPDTPDEGFEYWETLSWELADKYPADMIIVDERWASTSLPLAEAIPTWTTLPAVAAGQVTMWPAYWLRNYRDYATTLDRLTAAIDKADATIVP